MPRKAKTAKEEPAKAAAPKRKYTRKARSPKAENGARFGVFDDGTVELRLPRCAGLISPTDAKDLSAFIQRLS